MLAAIHYELRFPIDELIAEAASRLRLHGGRVGGVVQENVGVPREDGSCCQTMTLLDLHSGERFMISQALGADSRGCRLDPRGLAEVEARLEAAVDGGLDLLILNKFGRAEAEGRGLRAVLSRALAADISVLTAVRAPYDQDWQRFHDGMADALPADADAVVAWCVAALREQRHGPLALSETP